MNVLGFQEFRGFPAFLSPKAKWMGWGVTTVEPGSSFGNIIRQRGWFLIAGGCLPPKGLGDRGRMGGQGSHWEGVYYPGEKFPHFSFLIWVPALHCLIALARVLCKVFFVYFCFCLIAASMTYGSSQAKD